MICLSSHVLKDSVKNIVTMLTIKRIPDSEIIKSIFDQTNKTYEVSNLTRIKRYQARTYQWYKTMREGEYEYIHEFRERINEILDLQKRHYEIADSPTIPIPIKQASLFELHKLTVTLSNLFDVTPYITSNNLAMLPYQLHQKLRQQDQKQAEEPISYVV